MYDKHYEEGIYVDIVSGEPLFSSHDKYDSKTGWSSFTQPISDDVMVENTDYKLLYPRIELRSSVADSHLGHLFNDGSKDSGGVLYCINSAALHFVAKDQMEELGYREYLDEL